MSFVRAGPVRIGANDPTDDAGGSLWVLSGSYTVIRSGGCLTVPRQKSHVKDE